MVKRSGILGLTIGVTLAICAQSTAADPPIGVKAPPPIPPGSTVWTQQPHPQATPHDRHFEAPRKSESACRTPEELRPVEELPAGDDASSEAAAILRPTLAPAYWYFPPGGLTRYLIPSRGIINIDYDDPHVPVDVNSS